MKKKFLYILLFCKTIFFIFCFFVALKTIRRTNVILIGIFKNKDFFCVFKNSNPKTFVRLLFLKLNQSGNTKEKFFGGFSLKTKNTLFQGSKMVRYQQGTFKKSNLKFAFLHLFSNVKGSSMQIFTKNINIWAPWNILKIKTLTHVRRRAPKFWNWTSKIIPELWLLDLFCPIKKNFHTPPYCTMYIQQIAVVFM